MSDESGPLCPGGRCPSCGRTSRDSPQRGRSRWPANRGCGCAGRRRRACSPRTSGASKAFRLLEMLDAVQQVDVMPPVLVELDDGDRGVVEVDEVDLLAVPPGDHREQGIESAPVGDEEDRAPGMV